MKNINLTPHSSMPVRRSLGKKTFIFASLFLVMLLAIACFSMYISSDKQGRYKLVAKIGSFFSIEKPKKLIKIVKNKGNSDGEKLFEPRSIEQEAEDDIDKPEAEEKEVVSNETDTEPPGIETAEMEDLTKVGAFSVDTGEKSIPAIAEIEVAVPENKKEVLTDAETKEEERDKEKPARLEGALKITSHYYIQVCSCVIKENADKIFRKLGDQGYSPFMKEIVGHVKMHNIYTEDFEKKPDALEILNRLKNDGFDSVLLPVSGVGYRIRITSCFYLESAKMVIKRLNRLGYKTNMRKELIPTKMYSVSVGNFESLQEAETASQKLVKMGYQHPILKHNPMT